jgi:hypothetical protein
MSFRKSLGLYRARAVTALLFAALLAATGASSAGAAVSGELGTAWGEQGTGPGELSTPVILGVDSSDGSVFVGGYTAGGVLAGGSMRLQKFSEAGTIEAETTLPNSTVAERAFEGIVVNSTTDRLYLLQYAPGADSSNGKPAAQQILVFSTEPVENTTTHKMELVAPSGGPATLPVPDPTGAEAIDNPQEMVLDPNSGDLVIMGENRAGQFILQRVSTASTGSVGARYTESSDAAQLNKSVYGEKVEPEAPAGIAVGTDGTTYILTGPGGQSGGFTSMGWSLGAGFSGTPLPIPGISGISPEPEILRPINPGLPTFGRQVAISPDGNTLYWKTPGASVFAPAEMTIWGYSLADEHIDHIYGNGAGPCTVETSSSALASIGQDMVVLDEGSLAEEFSTFGVRVIKFGPGGSGCPAPAADLKLTRAGAPASTVPVGSSVTFDGSGSELGTYAAGGTGLVGATFKIEGPGGTVEEDVTTTEIPALTLSHQFQQEGTYTIRMEMELSGFPSTGKPLPTDFTLAAAPQTVTVGPQSGGPEFPLTVTKTGTGSGSVSSNPTGINCGTECSAEFAEATAVTLTATPATGSTFTGWTGAGCTGTGTCVVTMSAAKSVEAKFEPSATSAEFTLSVSKSGAGSGAVTSSPAGISCGSECSAKFAETQTVTLTATPASGSSFAGWSGACTGLGSCQVTMSAAKSVNAKFEPATGPAVFTLTVGKAGSGSGTVTSVPAGIDCGGVCSGNYQEGTTVTLTASAASGSTFAGWGGACSGTGNCVVALNSAKSVTATFNANPVSSPPPPTEIHPTPIPKPKPKPLKCKKGFKKGKVHGVAKCVKIQKHPAKQHKKSKNHKKK